MAGGQSEPATGFTAGSRNTLGVTGGLVVIGAVVAAPQFVLTPGVLVTVLVVGSLLGGIVVAVTRTYRPSPAFLVLLAPLVFLGFARLPEFTPLTRPALLVGIAAFTVAGAVTDRVTSR